MGTIHFFYEDISFKVKNARKLKTWISNAVMKEKSSVKEVNYIFCSDSYLLTLNLDYLNHNTYTDIITFDNAESLNNLEGDIFISIDRVRDNASRFKVSFEQELHRVMIHGVLHLLGYKDKTSSQKSLMRKKEEACLSLWN
jgi:probable rRNA maturation factor